MSFPFSIDATAVISGIIGILVGIVGTFAAELLLDVRKSRQSTRRLHCVLLSEIFKHQASLQRTLDFTLPAWLNRGYKRQWSTKDFQHQYLRVAYFETFFASLIDSPQLVPIAQYYDAVGFFNAVASDLTKQLKANGVAEKLVAHYFVDATVGALKASTYVADQLLADRKVRKYFSLPQKLSVENYKHSREHYLFLCKLAQTSSLELRQWDNQIRAVPSEIGRVPEYFRKHIDVWRNYLEAANAVSTENSRGA